MNGQVPWYRRTWVIVALLVVCAPAGIPLMWLFTAWARNAKIGISVVSALFFIAIATSRSSKDGHAAAGESNPAVAAQPSTKTAVEVPSSDLKSVEKEPKLLVPVTLGRFQLIGVNPLGECCAVAGYYQHLDDQRDADIYIVMTSDKGLPALDKGHRAFKVRDHEGVSFIDTPAGQNRAAIAWLSGEWQFTVKVAFKKSSERAAAVEAAEEMAPLVAAHADLYISGGAVPTAAEQKRQLDALTAAVDARKQQEKLEELRRGPERFMAAVRNAGVRGGAIVSAERDPLLEDRLLIVVGPAWHRQIKQERLIAAQNLWTAWAEINSPRDLDKSRIQLLDVNGNEVGGSDSVFGGASIAVPD